MSVHLNITLGRAEEAVVKRKLPGSWHKVKPLDSGQIERWMNDHGEGVYIEVTPDDLAWGGYALAVWVFNEEDDTTDTIGSFTVKRKAYAAAYDWMSKNR